MFRYISVALALIPLGAAFGATEFYSWHAVDAPVTLLPKKLEVVLHHRTRTRHEFSYLEQSRVGAILRWSSGHRIIPYVGYYYQPQQTFPDRWFRGQRLFVGGEAPFQLNTNLSLTMRVAAERHMGTGRPDYNRYRTYSRLVVGNGRVAPFLQNEFLAVRQGFHSVRNSGGLRLRLANAVVMDIGYLYDIRRTFWGGDRQALFTAIRLDKLVR